MTEPIQASVHAPATYDAILIGSGQASNPLAAAFSAAGKHVAVVERAFAGGTCGNYGCTPTKTLVASAEVASLARRASEYGVQTGAVAMDMSAVRQRKRAMVNTWRNGSEKRLTSAPGIDLIYGEGSFLPPQREGQHRIQIRSRNDGNVSVIEAPLIVIDTGLTAAAPPLEGLDKVPYLDNVSIMELDQLPGHLLVLGGGYVGLEFAQIFRRFGSQVTIIQNAGHLLAEEDDDITDAIASILREDDIEILLASKAVSVAQASLPGGPIRLTLANGQVLEGTHLLVATGRRPNTASLNLPAAGIETDAKGFIKVNEQLETNIPGIYAAGDVKGGPAFTHIAYDDFRILKANLIDNAGKKNLRSIRPRMLPYCTFIDPQFARIGLSERQAAEQGIAVRVARLPMTSVARAIETGQTRGFIKALVDPATDKILGAAVLSADGGEIMAMLQIAMMGGLPYTALQEGIFAHPTFAECFNNLFLHFD